MNLTPSEGDLLHLIKTVRSILEKKELVPEDLSDIEQLYNLYQGASELFSTQRVRLPPFSKVKIDLPSFCLDPTGGVPSENDRFEWTKEDPKIPYYSKIIRLASINANYTQEDFQELIWNLSNKARYEDYPLRLKKLLDHIDANAKFVLPSHAKDRVSNEVESIIREQVPQIESANDAINLIQGKYYEYAEIESLLHSRTQAPKQKPLDISALREDPKVYASVRSPDFSRQEVVFYNPNGVVMHIDITDYHLKPFSRNTQRIGLSVNSSSGNNIASAIDTALRDAIIRNSAYWYNGRLTQAEIAFLGDHPLEALNAYVQSRRAILSTWKYFARNIEGDESDAFRHFVWAGLLYEHLGEDLAREYLSAHEESTTADSSDGKSSKMDQHNNQEGLRIAKVLADKNELSLNRLEREGYGAILQNRLKVLLPKGKNSIYPVSE